MPVLSGARASAARRRLEGATMASDRELRGYVADRLHELVGFSDRTTSEFILAQAKKVKGSAGALARHLAAAGLPDTPAVAAFCGELLSRLPSSSGAGGGSGRGAASAVPEHARVAAEARALVKRSRAYGLLDDDDDSGSGAPPASADMPPPPPKQHGSGGGDKRSGKGDKEKHLRRSKAVDGEVGGGGAEDDPTIVRSSRGSSKRRWEEDEGEGDGGSRQPRDGDEGAVEARREAALEADQREKEEFEAR